MKIIPKDWNVERESFFSPRQIPDKLRELIDFNLSSPGYTTHIIGVRPSKKVYQAPFLKGNFVWFEALTRKKHQDGSYIYNLIVLAFNKDEDAKVFIIGQVDTNNM